MIDEIGLRLRIGARTGTFEGLIFHGTGEPWSGDPVVGGDGLFWTASDPAIALQYLPASGSSAIVAKPHPWRMGEMVVPENGSFWKTAAEQMTGLACRDVVEVHGSVKSWTAPRGWPSYGEVVAWLESGLGYRLGEETGIDVRLSWDGGTEAIMPADWLMEGTLLVTLVDGLEFRDLRGGDDGDLMNADHLRYDDFRAAIRNGVDGVIINDFAQTDAGNLGHVAYGLTARGLAGRQWVKIASRRYDIALAKADPVPPELKHWAGVDDVAGIEPGGRRSRG